MAKSILRQLRDQEMWFPDLYSESADYIEKLHAAILPFANCYNDEQWRLLEHTPDETIWKGDITFGDLRRLRSFVQ